MMIDMIGITLLDIYSAFGHDSNMNIEIGVRISISISFECSMQKEHLSHYETITIVYLLDMEFQIISIVID